MIHPVPAFDPAVGGFSTADAPRPPVVSECPGVAEAMARHASLWPSVPDDTCLFERPAAGYFAAEATARRMEGLKIAAANEARRSLGIREGEGYGDDEDELGEDELAVLEHRFSENFLGKLSASDWAHASDHRALNVGLLLQDFSGSQRRG